LIRWAMNHVAANAAAMGGALRATAVGFISVLSRLPSHPVNTKANSRAMILIRVIYSSCARDPTMAMSDLISAISAPSPHRCIDPVNGTRSTIASEFYRPRSLSSSP
jgi:hypothetical protein